MNGWHRFGLLILSCVAVMILFPNFGTRGWTFILFTILGGCALLLVISLLTTLFAIYRFELLNKIITLAFLCLVIYVLLWNFPQLEYQAPIYQLKAGRTPTKEDIERGLKRLTFNFDFVRRNVRRDENFSNQELPKEKPATTKVTRTPVKPAEQNNIEIVTE